jgi:hypothetical protein
MEVVMPRAHILGRNARVVHPGKTELLHLHGQLEEIIKTARMVSANESPQFTTLSSLPFALRFRLLPGVAPNITTPVRIFTPRIRI